MDETQLELDLRDKRIVPPKEEVVVCKTCGCERTKSELKEKHQECFKSE